MTPKHGENLLKKQTNTKIFYCNLESKNLSMHLRHHHTNSRQSTSERPRCSQSQAWAGHSSSELCCLAFIIIPCIVCNLLLTFLSSKCSTIASMMCSSVQISSLLWMLYYMNLLLKESSVDKKRNLHQKQSKHFYFFVKFYN